MPFADADMMRDAAFRLRSQQSVLSTALDEIDRARVLAGLEVEVAGTRELVVEVHEETGVLQQILELKADALDLADSGYSTGGASLMAELGRLSAQLRTSLNDDIGSGLGFSGTDEEFRAYYEAKAFENAGIDSDSWIPELGLNANRATVEAVYEYYADLYRENPDMFWWAGMAAMIGPSFLGGFADLEMFAGMLRLGGGIAGELDGIGTARGLGVLADLSAEELTGELDWYQTELLAMQQEIFIDMATAHEAYLDGGVAAIERLYANDDYDYGPETLAAWQQIDTGLRTGDADLVAAGNGALLFREQWYVIANDYDEMRDRPLTGEAMTYSMTVLGAPSIPGTQTFAEVFPVTIDASRYVGTPREITIIPWVVFSQSVPHVGAVATVTVNTPLPNGNVADDAFRWSLIRNDTLPVWTDLARNHPADVMNVLDTPVGERADDYRIDSNLARIARWRPDEEIDFDFEIRAGS